MFRGKFSERAGGGRTKGEYVLSGNGHLRVEAWTKSRKDLFGFKGVFWVELFEDGFHVFTSEKINVWANGRSLPDNEIKAVLTDSVSQEIMKNIRSPEIEVVLNRRSTNQWEESVKQAQREYERWKDYLENASAFVYPPDRPEPEDLPYI